MAILVATIILTATSGAKAQLPSIPSPTILGWPTCPEIQYQNGVFVYGDHATHHQPDDKHGIIENVLPNGTQLPNRNLYGVDDVYKVPGSGDMQFVQCYCAFDDPDVPDGYGIQTLWRVAQFCDEATGDEKCAEDGCRWNIPYYSATDNCAPAIALHSNFYACVPQCGNGVVDVNEQCDDGNRVDGDGCSAACQFEDEICTDQIDNDGDDLVDCFDTEDCACDPPFEDPTKIDFNVGAGGLDRLKASGFSPPAATFDPTLDTFCVMLATPTGKIWSECLLPGSFVSKGIVLRYKNKNAKNIGGFAKVAVYRYANRMKFTIQAYGDLTGACGLGVTGLQTTYGEYNVFFAVPWTPTSGGCKAHFIHKLP